MEGLKNSISNAQIIKKEMYKEWQDAIENKKKALFYSIFLRLIIIGFFFPKLKKNYKYKKRFSDELHKDYENFALSICFNLDEELLKEYNQIVETFDTMSESQKIWEIRSFDSIDQVRERTKANVLLDRFPTEFYQANLDILKSEQPALTLENSNGDIFIFPEFIIVKDRVSSDFALIDLKTIKISFARTSFIEEEEDPIDSKTLNYTWKYSNKDGTMDKRFKDNYQIPIKEYGVFSFQTNEGLNVEFMVSNAEICESFSKILFNFVNVLLKMNWNSKTEI